MPNPTRRTVLYVEDHPAHALLMAAVLERRPELELVVATTGQDALRLGSGLAPALLLLDLGLPDGHGSRLLALLRTHAGCRTAPAVAVTADLDFPVLTWDFCERWPKPLAADHVLARLDALLGTSPSPAPELPREWFAAQTPGPGGFDTLRAQGAAPAQALANGTSDACP